MAYQGFPGSSVGKKSTYNAGDRVQPVGPEDPLEKEMATHSSMFLPEKSHGQRSLVDYSPWAHRVSHDFATNEQGSLVIDSC